MVRSMVEGVEKHDHGRKLRNNIVEAMWQDLNNRTKKLGKANPGAMRRVLTATTIL